MSKTTVRYSLDEIDRMRAALRAPYVCYTYWREGFTPHWAARKACTLKIPKDVYDWMKG